MRTTVRGGLLVVLGLVLASACLDFDDAAQAWCQTDAGRTSDACFDAGGEVASDGGQDAGGQDAGEQDAGESDAGEASDAGESGDGGTQEDGGTDGGACEVEANGLCLESTWTSPANQPLYAVAANEERVLAVGGGGRVVECAPDCMVRQLGGETFYAVSLSPGGASAWVVGTGGNIWAWQRESSDWREVPTSDPTSVSTTTLRAVWSGDFVEVSGEPATIFRFNQQVFIPAYVAESPNDVVHALWGTVSGQQRHAVGYAGSDAVVWKFGADALWHRTLLGGAPLYALAGPSEEHLYAVGESGRILRYKASGTWVPEPVPETLSPGELSAVWVSDDGAHVWALGTRGVLVHKKPDSSWEALALPGVEGKLLTGIQGLPGGRLVISARTSSTQLGGFLLHYRVDGATW